MIFWGNSYENNQQNIRFFKERVRHLVFDGLQELQAIQLFSYISVRPKEQIAVTQPLSIELSQCDVTNVAASA
jgi:hypothetical protein